MRSFIRRVMLAAIVSAAGGFATPAHGQETDSLRQVEMAPLVVTGTRVARPELEAPVPMQVVRASAAREQGVTRMDELLQSVPGLALVRDHGTGLRIQGFDADYVQVLIDGNPVVGRTAGTLDLNRLSVAGVERVEVVRGPTSALYGSHALAGVVNIITREPGEGASSLQLRQEAADRTDLLLSASGGDGPWAGRLSLHGIRHGGYDATPATPGRTVPRYTDLTVRSRASYTLAPRTRLHLQLRGAMQRQYDEPELSDGTRAEDEARRDEGSVALRLAHRLASGSRLTTRIYGSRFRTETRLVGEEEVLLAESLFSQTLGRATAELDLPLSARQRILAGAGLEAERMNADRIRSGVQQDLRGFAFLQHELLPASWIDLVTSARLDVSPPYGTHLSPRIASVVRPIERLRLRASIGHGFKTPTFKQRYLDFTNATAGYTVIGSDGAAGQLGALDEAGQVVRYLLDPQSLGDLQPESSWAFNVGGSWTEERWRAQVNLFHNEVRDLIEAAPIAVKPTGQQIFTYFNRNRIYTRGLEAELKWRVAAPVQLSAAYTLLDTGDRDVLEGIGAGEYFLREGRQDRRVVRSDYGGLMNRSAHRLQLGTRLTYDRYLLSLEAQYRSRYGFTDRNGNLILDSDQEYAPGYWLAHAAFSAEVAQFTLQIGARNLLDTQQPTYQPGLIGRRFFASLRWAR